MVRRLEQEARYMAHSLMAAKEREMGRVGATMAELLSVR